MSTNATDQPGVVTSFRIVSWDVIDLPTDRISERLPVRRTVRDHPALPNRAFDIFMDWNDTAGYWTWKVELDEVGEIISRQPVHYGDGYTWREHIGFAFIDFSKEDQEVSPQTLGDEVELVAWPGARSPGWADWVARQEILERELPEVGVL
ncbi:phage baseplate plug protein [Saliphagus sp. LR7]|uniref:phage baseplate plug family protein n=1 Tax=Saliphagus sp. LR7 TaxID=2282654 RepID=UPI000DF84327|nr:hypothetical protein [Saliphagus sp. LR7]